MKKKNELPPVRKHVCWCGKSFPTSFKLRRHLTSHSDVRPFACTYPDCNGKFKARRQLRDHELRMHEKKGHSRGPPELVSNQAEDYGRFEHKTDSEYLSKIKEWNLLWDDMLKSTGTDNKSQQSENSALIEQEISADGEDAYNF